MASPSGRKLRGTVLVLLACLVVAGVFVFVYLRLIRPPAQEASEVVVCTSCRRVFDVHFRMGSGGGPYVCPHCGNQTAYLAYQCRDPECGTIFPVTPEQMRSGKEIVCPVCQGQAGVLLEVPPGADEKVVIPAE